MRRPKPTLMDTPRQGAAVIFAFEHYRVTTMLGRDGLQYLTVQHAFRNWLAEVKREELPQITEQRNRARGRCVCGAAVSKSKNATLCETCLGQLRGDLFAA